MFYLSIDKTKTQKAGGHFRLATWEVIVGIRAGADLPAVFSPESPHPRVSGRLGGGDRGAQGREQEYSGKLAAHKLRLV